jgi:hypothetical protein
MYEIVEKVAEAGGDEITHLAELLDDSISRKWIAIN